MRLENTVSEMNAWVNSKLTISKRIRLVSDNVTDDLWTILQPEKCFGHFSWGQKVWQLSHCSGQNVAHLR